MNAETIEKSADKKPGRRERRKQEFRDKIIASAIELFEEKGSEDTTLEEICERADISRPTFYSYYTGKQELIQAIANTMWLDLAEEFSEIQKSANSAEFVAAFIQLIKQDPSTSQ